MAKRIVDISRGTARRSLALVFALYAVGVQAGERQPHEVIVTPDTSMQSAINEDGIVEANAARVEHGVVYLEFQPAAAEAGALAVSGR